MGAVEEAVDELVADRRPGFFPLEDQLQPFRAGESDFGGGDQHRGVGQRDVSDAKRRHPSSSALVMMDWAISLILHFRFMAVRRRSA